MGKEIAKRIRELHERGSVDASLLDAAMRVEVLGLDERAREDLLSIIMTCSEISCVLTEILREGTDEAEAA